MESTGLEWSIVLVIVLLVVNTVAALVMIVFGLLRKPGARATCCLRGVFFLACPVVGPLAFLVSGLLTRLMRTQRFDRESLTFSTERTAAVLPPDEKTEMNYIPIMDALESADTAELRQLLLNVLKNKSILSIHSVTSAVASDDAETSHYAASALANFLSEYRAAAREKLLRVEHTPDDTHTLLDAISFFQVFIKARIMDDVEQRSYIYTFEDLNEKLYTGNRWFMTAQHFQDVTDDLISIGDYATAAKWVSRARECRPDELETYKAALHLYYSMGQREKVMETLDGIRHSDVLVDREVLDLIRILNEGE